MIERQQHASGVVELRFNRPDVMNALTLEMMHDFADHIAALTAEATLRALVLTGAGTRAFCSGGDLAQLSQYETEGDARAMITVMGDALARMERLPVPVIAAVNGYALGGGSEIALACDLRIADEQVRMGMVQINMGLTPGWGAGQRLLRLVGYAHAMEILLRGQPLDAPTLTALGLVNQVVPAGSAREVALTLAQEIADRPPAVVRAIKALLRAGLTQPYEVALAAERELFPSLWADEPHLQAVRAFLERDRRRG